MLVPLFLGTGGATSMHWRAFGPDEILLAAGSTWATMLTEAHEHLGDHRGGDRVIRVRLVVGDVDRQALTEP